MILAVMVLASVVASAEEPTQTVSTSPGQQTRGAQLGSPQLQLRLQEAVTLALDHNINLEISRLGLASYGEGIVAAGGIFDPTIAANYLEQSSKSPATNQLVGAEVNESKRRTFDLSLGQYLPTGADVRLGWDNTRTSTNSTFYFLNPSYDSGLNFSLSQPLLRGFGTDVNRTGIEVARRSREIGALQFEAIVIATIGQVESAYWNLVYRIDNLKVKQQSLKLAQDLLDQTRTRVRIGTSAPIDIVQSEATVAVREQEIIVAENAVVDAGDQLKSLMGFERPDDWNTVVVPMDSLEVSTDLAVDLDVAISQALETRPVLRQRAAERQIRELNYLVADNSVKPALDLSVAYGYSGVGGTLHAADATIAGGWDDAMQQIWDRDYPQWSAGLGFSYTLGNHQAKAQRAQRRYDLAIADQNIALERQSVIEETRRAVRVLQDSAKSIAAAVKARELAERNVDAEQKKFANGMSTNFLVLQVQEDLAIAQAAELQSRVTYRQAVVAYQAAVGILLEGRGIQLRDDEAAEEPHPMLKDVEYLRYRHWAKSVETPTAAAPDAADKE
ncbi:MAG: TolC family protein [Acidobacteria bacterium]|nr:TolC family protein [Acidobacteriota bacterium]